MCRALLRQPPRRHRRLPLRPTQFQLPRKLHLLQKLPQPLKHQPLRQLLLPLLLRKLPQPLLLRLPPATKQRIRHKKKEAPRSFLFLCRYVLAMRFKEALEAGKEMFDYFPQLSLSRSTSTKCTPRGCATLARRGARCTRSSAPSGRV